MISTHWPGRGGVLTYVDMRHVPRSRVGFPRARPYVRVCFGHFESVLPYLRVYQCSAPNLILQFHSQYVRYFVQFTFLYRHGRKISLEKCIISPDLTKIFTCFGILPYIRVCFWDEPSSRSYYIRVLLKICPRHMLVVFLLGTPRVIPPFISF